ncbi:hypothetical protein GCM10011581_44820 [Saccharopolyspora subtropica]|uniref:Transmembrane protein n=2 Tax=Saccharopolyspora thermophila TaxID=89367 RepID=A0A917K7I9_9PSEU|nr:hypothetical protein GCM10011581_44820 [Saccharopolyspora subtropica]
MIAALKAHATWLVNALGMSRNPLRRPIDRAAAAISLLLLTAAVVVVPVSALFGVSLHENLTQRAAYAAQTTHRVDAVLTTAPTMSVPVSEVYTQDSISSTAVVEWRTDQGTRTATMQVPANAAPGDTVPLWIDQAGNRVPPPPTPGSVTVSAVFAALLLLLVLELGCFALISATQRLARRIGMRAWEREWAFLQRGGTWSQR